MEERDFAWFTEMILAETAIDLSLYKENQMKRRLTTLMHSRGYEHFHDYYAALARDPKLMEELLDRMTINVSEFWRNPNVWKVLQEAILPEMKHKQSLKVWSSACSTGEEPYTLAMIFNEMGLLSRTTMLASDLDQKVLTQAKRGIYASRNVREVPAQYLKKYFTAEDDVYQVDRNLQRNIRFFQLNLLSDPFPERVDLIVCRNVLIYFTNEAKDLLYHKFTHALNPGGILFVGSTEQIFQPGQYGLETAGTFFYRKKEK